MTIDQFDRWTAYHGSLHRGFIDWLSEDGNRQAELYEQLGNFDETKVFTASVTLRKELDGKPIDFGEHGDRLIDCCKRTPENKSQMTYTPPPQLVAAYRRDASQAVETLRSRGRGKLAAAVERFDKLCRARFGEQGNKPGRVWE